MLRTFQFRLLPSAAQRAALERILVDNAETYNAALEERIGAWKLQRKPISYFDQQAQLTALRADGAYNWLAVDIMRDPLRRVDRAFKAFFRRCKTGQKPGFPRFRSLRRYDSFTMTKEPNVKDKFIRIPNVGNIRMRGGRPVAGLLKIATVKRDGKRWNVSIVCDVGAAPEKVAVSKAVGIDVGLTTLATLSDGTQIENPHWTRKHENRIADANRRLSRKQKRSKNRIRAREALRRAHQRASNARKNYLHHVSKWLISNYDLIAHEDLGIQNMVKSHLAKGIMDAAWGQLIWQLTYKAESAGRWVVPVNPCGTSQNCSGCGEKVPKKLSQRVHDCPHCGLVLGRDHNAGLNILALGMSAAGCGLQNVRPEAV